MSNIIIPTFNENHMKKTYEYLNKTGHTSNFYQPEYHKKSANFDHDYIIKELIEIRDHRTTESSIKDHINYLLAIEGIENRIGLIDDGSFCNFRILISPDEFWFTSTYELRKEYPIAKEKLRELNNSIEEIINFFMQHGERIMISISHRTFAERTKLDY